MKIIRIFFEKIVFLIILFIVMTMSSCDIKKTDDINDDMGEKQYKTISLKDGLEIIYDNKESDNLHEYKYENFTKEKEIIRRRARKVEFEGSFSYAYSDYIVLDNVIAGEEVYNNICIRLNSNYEDINVKKLLTGDKVNVTCTIMTQKDDCGASSINNKPYLNKFYVVNSFTKGYDENYDECIISYDFISIDEIYPKYANKKIMYEYENIYEDMINIISENPNRFEKIFDGIKFKAIIKMDEIYKKYSTTYLGCEVKHKHNVKDFDYSNVKYGINSIYIGDGKYVFDKNKMYLSYDEDEITAVIAFEKNKHRNWYEAEFQISKFKISFLNTVNDMEETDAMDVEDYDFLNDFGEEMNIKVVGKDDISIGDLIYFGKRIVNENKNFVNKQRVLIDGKYIEIDLPEDEVSDDKYNSDNNYVFNVIKIDNNNPNKVLIMLNEPLHLKYSDEKKCTWHDSFMREYLNIDFLNVSFTDDEKNRMYQTCNKDCLYKVIGAKDKESIDILFPLSKDEVIENQLFIPLETKGVLRYQEFSAENICLFAKNSYEKKIKINSASVLSFSWSVYPCVWINIDKTFSEMENSAYDYKF